MSGFRRVDASESIIGEQYVNSTVGVTLRRRFLRKYYVLANASYTHGDYENISNAILPSREDDYFSVRVGLGYHAAKYLDLGLFYLHQRNDSSLASYAFTSNRVYLQSNFLILSSAGRACAGSRWRGRASVSCPAPRMVRGDVTAGRIPRRPARARQLRPQSQRPRRGQGLSGRRHGLDGAGDQGQHRQPAAGRLHPESCGRTPAELGEIVKTKLHDGYLVHPQVTVSVLEFSKRRFTILGEVNKPGQIDFPDNADLDVLQALGMAGGYTKQANPARIYIKRRVNDREVVLTVDAKRMARRDAPPFKILPGDTITVGETIF